MRLEGYSLSTELLLPVLRVPSFEEFYCSIYSIFKEFSVPTQHLILGVQGSERPELEQGFGVVQEASLGVSCWVSFSLFDEGLREPEEIDLCYMAGVSAKGRKNRWLMAIVSYALCKYLGRVVYDDSLILGGGQKYSLDEFRLSLCELLNKGE